MVRGPPRKDDCTLYRASKGWGLYRVCKERGFNVVKMTQEDREYFKNGVKTLCGTELVFAIRVIEDKDFIKAVDSKDLEFMKKELGRRAGAIWAELLRALKKMDFKEAEKIITGGTGE